MPNVKLAVNPINVPDFCVIVVEKVALLGVEVTRHVLVGNTQTNLTTINLDPQMYRYFFWQSSDGDALDTLLGSCDIDAATAADAIFEIYELTVDGGGPYDPAAADTEIEIVELEGVKLAVSGVSGTGPSCQVFQRGVGPKIAGEIEDFSATGRGFRLLNGDAFNEGDIWIVNAYRKVPSAPVSGITYPDDIVEIAAAETDLDLTHINKELEMTGGMAVQRLKFMDLAGQSDKKYFIVNTHRFTGNYVWIDLGNGGTIWQNGAAATEIFLPAGHVFSFALKGGVGRITADSTASHIRGRIVGDYKERLGHVQAIGTEYTLATMPGLYRFVESLPVGYAATFTEWNLAVVINAGQINEKTIYPNKGRFAIDAGTTSIKVPDLRNMSRRFLKLAADALRPSNVPGGYQVDRVGNFTGSVTLPKGYAYTGGPNNGRLGNGFNTPQNIVHNGVIVNTGNTETTMENTGEIPLVTL